MAKMRQDAWTEEYDRLLAETVLRHIREGSTQLKAFDEVGDKLNRTSAACGFRWNAIVRNDYREEIEEAKRERKKRKRQEANNTATKTKQTLTIDDIIRFLEHYEPKKSAGNSNSLQKENEMLKREKTRLEEEKKQLESKISRLEKEHGQIKEDYQSLIQIMERARKMVVFHDDELHTPPAFKMDKNGNLEKMAK